MSKRSKQQSVSNPRCDSATIMLELDRWVAVHGNGEYLPADCVPPDCLALFPDYGIQQVRSELDEFVAEVVDHGLSGTALEIGLGYYGSTHFLWRSLFDRVITIEKNHERVRAFGSSMQKYYDKWVLGDGRSSFIFGLSYEPNTISNLYGCCIEEKIDLLFLDGDHAYGSVLADWLLYQGLVRPGGIIAFHDSLLAIPGHYGVPEFIDQLTAGKIDGKARKINNIELSECVGIAWYQQM